MREHGRPVAAAFADGKPEFSDPSRLHPFGADEIWGGFDLDAWFRVEFTVPPEMDGRDVWLEVHTGFEDQWNAVNPQMLLFVDGRESQGLDTNHTTTIIAQKATVGNKLTIDLDAWSGAVTDNGHLRMNRVFGGTSKFVTLHTG